MNAKNDPDIDHWLQEQPSIKSVSPTEMVTPVRICADTEGLFNEMHRQETRDLESACKSQSEDAALGCADSSSV